MKQLFRLLFLAFFITACAAAPEGGNDREGRRGGWRHDSNRAHDGGRARSGSGRRQKRGRRGESPRGGSAAATALCRCGERYISSKKESEEKALAAAKRNCASLGKSIISGSCKIIK